LGEFEDPIEFLCGKFFLGLGSVGIGHHGRSAVANHRATQGDASIRLADLKRAHLDCGTEELQVHLFASPDSMSIEFSVTDDLEFVIALVIVQHQYPIGGQVNGQQGHESLGQVFD
jgi:hypothetical protein